MPVNPLKYRLIGAADTNATVVKAKHGRLRSVSVFSIDATPVYVKFYNKATAPDENDVPVASVECPAPATAALGSYVSRTYREPGIDFDAGLAFRIVTGIADNSTGALSASEVVLNLEYD